MKKVYLVFCDGMVSDEAYSTVEGALNFISNRYGAITRSSLDEVKIAPWTYSFGGYIYQITDVSVKED